MTEAEKVAEKIEEIEAIIAVAEAEMAEALAEQPGVPSNKNRRYRTAQARVRENNKRKMEKQKLSTTEDEAGPSNRL